MPMQTGQVCVFGGAPNLVLQGQNSLLAVSNCTCTSRPMTVINGSDIFKTNYVSVLAFQRWLAGVPIGSSLEHVSGTKQTFFTECRALQLQANRQTGFAKFARECNAAQAGEIQTDGIQIDQIHRERIVTLFANFESRRAGDGTGD